MTSIIEKLKISQSNSRKLDAFFSFSLFLVFFSHSCFICNYKNEKPKISIQCHCYLWYTFHVITRVCFVCLCIIPILVIKCLKMYVSSIYIPVIFLYYYLKLLNNTWVFLDGYIVNMPVTCYIFVPYLLSFNILLLSMFSVYEIDVEVFFLKNKHF